MKVLTININEIVIKPITNDDEFERAGEIIDALIDYDLIEDAWVRKQAADILEAITILAIDYEKRHYPIPKPNPIDAIKQRMEQLNLSQKDVAKFFGGVNRVSEVLNGKRKLSLRMIKALHSNLNIPTNILIRDIPNII